VQRPLQRHRQEEIATCPPGETAVVFSVASKVDSVGTAPNAVVTLPAIAARTEGGKGAFCEEVQQVKGGIIGEAMPKQESVASQKPLVKAIRTITQVVKKRTANVNQLFGAGSRFLSLVFSIKKQPERSQRRALQIALPYPILPGQLAEGLFIKAGGRRQLVFQFGLCCMEEENLIKNASAVLDVVKRTGVRSLVQEIRVQEMDGLALPVWDVSAEKRLQRSKKRQMCGLQPSASMLPPPVPTKRIKV